MRSYWSVLHSITPVMRFCWNVLRLVHACHTFLLECFAFDHACLFSFVRKREAACGMLRFYSARVGIAISAFSNVVRLSNFVGSLLDCPFLYGDPDGVRRDAETRGTESAARQNALLREPLGLAMLSAGSTLGLRAPDCAKEPLALWTLFLGFAAKYLLPNLAIIAIFESTHPGPAVTRVHGKT